MQNSSWVDLPAVYFDGGAIIGKITGYITVNGKRQAIFEESTGKNPLKFLKHLIVGKSRVVPLQGLHILEDIKVRRDLPTRIPPSRGIESKDDSICIRQRNRDLILIPVSVDELKPDQVVVWNPDGSPNPEDSYIGEIQKTFINFDIKNVGTFYAQLEILEGIERLRSRSPALGVKFIPVGGRLQCRAWAPITELMKVGEFIQNVAENGRQGTDGQSCSSSLHTLSSCDDKEKNFSHTASGPSPFLCPSTRNINDNQVLMETDLDEEVEIDKELKQCFIKNLEKARCKDNFLKGINGKSNSCYMDSTLFVLFSFSTTFDSILLEHKFPHESTLAQNVRKSLGKIADRLRNGFYVHSGVISELRNVMDEINGRYKSGYFMDTEELLLDLFDCLGCPDFFEFTNGAKDRIHQIVLPATQFSISHTEANIFVKDVDTLLKDSLWSSDVQFIKRPNPVLILKLPFCNGLPLFGCTVVVPNLTLELGPLCRLEGAEQCSSVRMELFAIICLKSSHYVSFVKAGNEEFSPWIYFDSSPMDLKPKMDVLDNLGHDIMKVANDPFILNNSDSLHKVEYREHVKIICSYCYMCFYK